ncbi:MAG: ABC transporter ATP-binding protein, partial [Actinomycetaceae bacterium UMB1218B]|nr:ABC transporter ATP-binding protein [Actinomycetaceae bacterium UMB1218B]
MFMKQRLVMRAAGVSVGLLAPAVLSGVLVSGLFIATAVCNALLFNELLTTRYMPTVMGLIVAIVILLL